MRQPSFIGATAAAAVLAGSVIAGGTAAFAESPETDPTGPTPAPTTVTLPTGDRVTVLPNGTTGIDPGPGRENTTFLTPPSPSGDIMVVPTDRVAAIQAGDEDPRRYNVSELLAAGQTDAAAAAESELDDRDYAGLIPEAESEAESGAESEAESGAETTAEEDLYKLGVTLRDRDGEAPDGSWMLWSERSGADFGDIPIEPNGEGSVALAPGDYVIVSGFWSDATDAERGQLIMGMTPVTITDTAHYLTLDGNDAQPVSVDVEQDDAQFLNASMAIEARAGEDVNLGYGNFLGPQDDAFLLPEPDLPEFELGFIYQPVLTSPEGAEDPYVYNLAFHDAAGFPDETAFSVGDDDLAAVDTDYRDLGVPFGADSSDTCDYGDHTERQIGMGFCRLVDTAVPSQRTMYYTADPGIEWKNGLGAGEMDEWGNILNGFVASYEAVFEPGESERVMPRGGLSAGTGGTYRFNEEGTEYLVSSSEIGGGNDETLILVGGKGNVELSRDGETLATAEGLDFYWENFVGQLPEGDTGRYTITADLTQPATATVFGTDATIEWTFDSAPVAEGEFQEIGMPVVQLTADDIEGGYAPRRGCQEITLDLRSDEYGPVVHAVDMTFEVSYDDGKTWRKVRIDREGDTATAELRHPRSAQFVSVRMTAVDDAGTEVTHTTIRAYGLK